VSKVTVTVEVIVDVEELGSLYTNEDYLVDQVKEHITYGLDRFGAEEVTFVRTDVEGT
jgi:hypothetical protein